MKHILVELQRISRLLLKDKRLSHVESCVNFAVQLASIHGVNEDQVKIASFAHDIFRDLEPSILIKMASAYKVKVTRLEKLNPILLHGKVAAEYVRRRFYIDDKEILEAIAYHTSGKENLGDVGKIVFLSDSLEENRIYEDVEFLRQMAKQDLNHALYLVVANKILYAVKRRLFVLPETVKMWNWLVRLRKEDSAWN